MLRSWYLLQATAEASGCHLILFPHQFFCHIFERPSYEGRADAEPMLTLHSDHAPCD
jgi:hypothetical protein